MAADATRAGQGQPGLFRPRPRWRRPALWGVVALQPSACTERASVMVRWGRAAVVEVPRWTLAGDWFDVCSCDIPCPCEFAQAPTNNVCEGVLAYHVREGNYGDVRLDGLNVLALGGFTGNVWA